MHSRDATRGVNKEKTNKTKGYEQDYSFHCKHWQVLDQILRNPQYPVLKFISAQSYKYSGDYRL